MMNITSEFQSDKWSFLTLQEVGVSSSVQFMGGAECPVSTGLSLTRRDTGPGEALAGTSSGPQFLQGGSTCRSGHCIGIRHTQL